MRKLLPPTEICSSPWFLFPWALVLLLILVAALLGHSLSQVAPVPPCFSPCPMDWLHSRNRCYYFSTMYRKEGDWDESQRVCSSHNGSLALFDTQEELNFLLHICSVKHMWIGLQRSGSGIRWANGTACNSSLCKVPDSGDCAYIQDDALWVSGCDLQRPYICTKETSL
ncbi:C-type lectin domain family 2 member B-like isoform X2 [Lissotriton helveticus]